MCDICCVMYEGGQPGTRLFKSDQAYYPRDGDVLQYQKICIP